MSLKQTVFGTFYEAGEDINEIPTFVGPLGPPLMVSEVPEDIQTALFRQQKVNEDDEVYIDRMRRFYGLTVEQLDQIWGVIDNILSQDFWPIGVKGPIENDCT